MKSQINIKCVSDIVKEEEEETPNAPKKTSFFHIDRDTWRFKFHFFMFIGGSSAVFIYVPDYAKSDIGMSTTALAMVLLGQQFLFVVTKPVIGYLADYFNKIKALICILVILQGVCFAVMLFIPKIKETTTNKNSLFFSEPCIPVSGKHISVSINDSLGVIPSRQASLCLETITKILTNNSESNELKKCNLFNSSTANLTFEGIPYSDSEYCSLETFQIREINCLPCAYNELVYCDCIYTCTFSKKRCLCLLENSSSKDDYNSFRDPIHCICYNPDIYHDVVYIPSLNASDLLESPDVHKSDFRTYQFWIFAITYTIGMVCDNAAFTLSDTACYESVEKLGSEFGRQRLWGAIGGGVMAPLAGLLNDYIKNYLPSWIIMEVFLVITVWNISKLELYKPQSSQNILKDVGRVLKSGVFLTFQAGLLLNGICAAMIWYYQILFLISIGGSKLLCGLVVSIQCFFGTIPFMFFSERIINVVGHLNVLSSAFLMYTVRFLWYSYLYNPWLVLIVEFLHGVTYGLMYATVVSFGNTSALPGTEATTQSLLFVTFGLGIGLGCILGGIGFDHFAGRKIYFIASIFTVCCVVMYQICVFFVSRRTGIVTINRASNISTVAQ